MLETERLILRQWKESDKEVFAKLNGDAETMLFFPKLLSREESDAFVDRTIEVIDSQGFGLFAIEIKETKEFIGFTGLANPKFEAPFTPCTEIGWRLYKDYWKKGYATEAAQKVLNFAFNNLKLEEVVSFTSHHNIPSIKVMERIGMKRNKNEDFLHPNVENGHKLKPHVLYRITGESYL